MFCDNVLVAINPTDHTYVSVLGTTVACFLARLDRDYFEATDSTIPMIVEFTGRKCWYRVTIDYHKAVLATFVFGATKPTIQIFTNEDQLRPELQKAVDDHVAGMTV